LEGPVPEARAGAAAAALSAAGFLAAALFHMLASCPTLPAEGLRGEGPLAAGAGAAAGAAAAAAAAGAGSAAAGAAAPLPGLGLLPPAGARDGRQGQAIRPSATERPWPLAIPQVLGKARRRRPGRRSFWWGRACRPDNPPAAAQPRPPGGSPQLNSVCRSRAAATAGRARLASPPPTRLGCLGGGPAVLLACALPGSAALLLLLLRGRLARPGRRRRVADHGALAAQ
jgi:hypothetical protein